MDNDQRSPDDSTQSSDLPRRRQPPPPTIDLKATEIPAQSAASDPASSEPSATSGQAPQPDATQTPTAKAEAPSQGGPGMDAVSDATIAAAGAQSASPPPRGDAETAQPSDSRVSEEPLSPGAAASKRPAGGISLGQVAAGVAGGVVAALVVVAALSAGWFGSQDTNVTALLERLDRVEARLGDGPRREQTAADTKAVEDLAARLARLESASPGGRPAALDPALSNRLSSAEAAIKTLADGVANLNRRADELAATARATGARVEAAGKSIADLAHQTAAQPSTVDRADLDELLRRMSAFEAAGKSVDDKIAKLSVPMDNRAVRVAVLALALKTAVDRGVPYAAELAGLQPMAPDRKALEPLTPFAAAGLPGAASLSAELSALTAKMNVIGRDQGADFLTRLQANAERLVRVRPIGAAAGNDPAAIIARVEFKAAHDDLAGALVELGKLPADMQRQAEPWVKKVEARNAASAAAQRVATAALAALGPAVSQGGAQQ